MIIDIKIIKLIGISLFVFFNIENTNGQTINVVDNKGTIVSINNNHVFKTTNAATSTPATFTFTISPAENDTFIYELASGEHQTVYIYDGTTWNQIAPTKASRIFYPPSIALDAGTVSANLAAPGDELKDLYQDYINQFTLVNATTSVSSAGAPGTIPTYARTELYYYITYYDPTVFDNVAIDANGNLTYDIIATPSDDNTLINVVFVVK